MVAVKSFRIKMVSLVAFAGFALMGCVTLGNGKVSKVVSDKEADVTTTDDNLKSGDAVGVYVSVRDWRKPKQGYESKKLGDGKVVSVSNSQARVQLDNGQFTEEYGTIFVSKIGGEKVEDNRFRSGRNK